MCAVPASVCGCCVLVHKCASLYNLISFLRVLIYRRERRTPNERGRWDKGKNGETNNESGNGRKNLCEYYMHNGRIKKTPAIVIYASMLCIICAHAATLESSGAHAPAPSHASRILIIRKRVHCSVPFIIFLWWMRIHKRMLYALYSSKRISTCALTPSIQTWPFLLRKYLVICFWFLRFMRTHKSQNITHNQLESGS